jgi:hypothetical protein
MNSPSFTYRLTTVLLRGLLVAALVASGWFIYAKLPKQSPKPQRAARAETNLVVVLQPNGISPPALDIAVELYPIDIVAVRNEYFTERRAGKRFDDFLSERMQGRKPIMTTLDKDGRATVVVSEGTWWLHALLSGDEDLEWRLPLNINGTTQTVELTSQNIYTRTKSF